MIPSADDDTNPPMSLFFDAFLGETLSISSCVSGSRRILCPMLSCLFTAFFPAPIIAGVPPALYVMMPTCPVDGGSPPVGWPDEVGDLEITSMWSRVASPL